MLNNEELTHALITNLEGWDWDINNKFMVDEVTGKALVEVFRSMEKKNSKTIGQQLEEIGKTMCDDYCKYPSQVHQLYLMDDIKENEKDDYLMEHYCNYCPMTTRI